jgi:hypothetical protein
MAAAVDALAQENEACTSGYLPPSITFVPWRLLTYWMVPPTFRAGLSPQLLSHVPTVSGNAFTDTPRSFLY